MFSPKLLLILFGKRSIYMILLPRLFNLLFSSLIFFRSLFFFFLFMCFRHCSLDKNRTLLMLSLVKDVTCVCALIHYIKWWNDCQNQVISSSSCLFSHSLQITLSSKSFKIFPNSKLIWFHLILVVHLVYNIHNFID